MIVARASGRRSGEVHRVFISLASHLRRVLTLHPSKTLKVITVESQVRKREKEKLFSLVSPKHSDVF